MNIFKNCIIFVCIFLVLKLQKIYCTHFTIAAYEIDGFNFDVDKDNIISGSYEIVDTNSICIISIFFYEDNKKITIFNSNKKQDQFNIPVKIPGMYTFFYENKGNADITFMFTLRIKEHHNIHEYELGTQDDVKLINNETYELYEQFTEVYNEQERMMEKADLYSQFNEKMNSKLILWSEIQIILLIIITFIHIHYIKSFFEIKTIV